MELLQLLSWSKKPLSLKELSAQCGYPKSTVFGLLTTMRTYDVVTQTPDGKYSLGLRLFEYGRQVERSWDISLVARPYMEHLCQQTGASVVLSVCEGGSVVTLDQAETRGGLHLVSDVGSRLPLYCTSQGKVFLANMSRAGAEALLRWTTGTGRKLYPDQFIPLFEQNGFSVSLDLYMVECACKQLRAWLDQGIQPVPLSVNQSKLLFFEADYIQNLERLIERYQIPASWITLEILEGLALENAGELNARISQLQAIGFRISMDDFGSGYSSLNTLNSLQIDELKLDRGFLMEAADKNDPRSRIIMEQVVRMAKQLGISVVVISHQMSVVEEICDRVAILDGGVVVEQGEVREIFANPTTAAAKRLVAPNGGSAARDLSSFAPDDHVVRVTFNGSSTAKPLVASLAAEKGILVSVLSADTRDLSGQCYGSMLLKLPRDTEQAKQAVCYMRSQNGVTVEEVTGE